MPGIVIVGAGFGGIGMGIALKQAGYDDFIILDSGDDLGGTWRDNQYPGCACDVPSPLYSYSFEPNPDWSRLFAPQPEIFAYLRGCARKYGLEANLRTAAWSSRCTGTRTNGAGTCRPSSTASWAAGGAGGGVGGRGAAPARLPGHPGGRAVRRYLVPLGALGSFVDLAASGSR